VGVGVRAGVCGRMCGCLCGCVCVCVCVCPAVRNCSQRHGDAPNPSMLNKVHL
jgi:hypothetical protein